MVRRIWRDDAPYASNGQLLGYAGPLDLNVFRGDYGNGQACKVARLLPSCGSPFEVVTKCWTPLTQGVQHFVTTPAVHFRSRQIPFNEICWVIYPYVVRIVSYGSNACSGLTDVSDSLGIFVIIMMYILPYEHRNRIT